MDKDKNDSGKIIKLDNKERKILRTIDKSSKWEDIKAIKDINEEILDLDIYKDFIGLGCSRYMNESADSGKLDIEEMFRNCREAEKVRVRVKKKTKKEEAQSKGGKKGRGGGNIGQLVKGNQDKSIKDIDTKQEKKSSAIVDKAKEIAKGITESLTKGAKGDDWKAMITKTGLKYGLEGLFAIVIGVMEYSVEDPVGAVSISFTAMGLIASIYEYLYELETGKKIVDNVDKWIRGKLNELYDYIMGNDIKVIKKKKKKKKKSDKGGSKKDDDDDDDEDDDDSGDFYEVDFDELNSYESDTTEPREEETKEETKEEQQDLTGSRETQRVGQMNNLETILPYLLQQQSRQQQQNLINTNTERLFQQNAENPMPKTGGEELTPPKAKKEAPPQEPDRPQQKAESLNPDRPTRGGMFGGLGQDERKAEETGKDTTGRAGLRDFAKDSFGAFSMYKMGSKLYEAMGSPFTEGGEILGQAQAGMEGTGVGGTGEEFFDAQQNPLNTPQPNTQSTTLLPQMRGGIEPRYNRGNSLTQTDITNTNLTPDQQAEMEQARKEIKEQAEQIKRDKERKQEQENKINEAIEDMDLRGRAWGLVNPGSQGGKTGADSLSSLITGIGLTDRARTQIEMRDNILSNVRQDEQNTLLNDIQEQERIQYEGHMRERNRNKKLQKQNQRLKAQMSLVEAREKGIDEKMTPDQAEAVADQERIERGILAPPMEVAPPIEDTSPPVEQLINPDMELALQVIGQTRGRRPAGQTEEDARQYLMRIMEIPISQNAVSVAVFRRYVNNIPQENTLLRERLINSNTEITATISKEKTDKGSKKARANLSAQEIQKVANIIKMAEMRQDPPRQERKDMGKGKKK